VNNNSNHHSRKVAVIGLGYVGLPVAVALAKVNHVVGFDIDCDRIDDLKAGHDYTGEVEDPADLHSKNLVFTYKPEDMADCNFFIVAVPTPVDEAKIPNLKLVYLATETVGKVLKKGDIVVYESTVYPGTTEEECVPILEKVSGLTNPIDFTVGFSPERINPGDREHTFTKITKVVSGQDQATLDTVAEVYGSVVTAGVYKATSVKVAEASKIIENTQRDLNIALMNELAIIFDRMQIDTKEVLEAAGTKWNFLKFFPGLVGGHCIGVDPYYLTYKSTKMGYPPRLILEARRINDEMGFFLADRAIREAMLAGLPVRDAQATVLGLTFKENVPDLRNTRVVDVISRFEQYGLRVQVADPMVTDEMAQDEYGLTLTPMDKMKPASVLVLAVAHREYCALGMEELKKLMLPGAVVVDVRGIADAAALRKEGFRVWRL
jgi:UDP-N-acetyl-D-glucosamine/UDP-N-acetyl-D-galactosamine dehydrogenase